MNIITYQKHTHQVHVMMGGKAYPLGHAHQLAAYLLNNILGGGALNSRLNLSLREQRGLVYTVESTYTPLSDTGYWCIYFACDKEDKETCTQLVLAELQQLREHPLTDKQLAAAKHTALISIVCLLYAYITYHTDLFLYPRALPCHNEIL